jgi:hypothetical protein
MASQKTFEIVDDREEARSLFTVIHQKRLQSPVACEAG